MVTNAVEKRVSHAGLNIFMACCCRLLFTATIHVCKRKILLRLSRPYPIHPDEGAGRYSPDFLKGRKRLGHAAEQAKSNPASWLRMARDLAPSQQRLDLRRKPQRPPVIGIVERLDTVGITHEQKCVLVR